MNMTTKLIDKPDGIDAITSGFAHTPTPLDALFLPRTVAVIGATEKLGTMGRLAVSNLLDPRFHGAVYPVNRNGSNIFGMKSFCHVQDVPETIDLALVITPSETVPGIVAECAAAGVQSVIVFSAGFSETGEEGVKRQQELRNTLDHSPMRMIGPNCMGIMNPVTGLNATFSQKVPRAGNVAFLSQSGALGTAVLDWCMHEMVGFSAFVSIGAMVDVGWGELIDYFGNDPNTHAIICYMESVGDARSFLSAAREVSLSKPIIIVKSGRTAVSSNTATSHTGGLAGRDDVLEAAFERCGVLRVNGVDDLFYMAGVLANQPSPLGNRLTVITNAGGPGVLATDALIMTGGQLANLTHETIEALDMVQLKNWSRGNPIDILAHCEPRHYAQAIEIASKDPNCDGMLVITVPQGLADPTTTAELIRPYAHSTGKPILASFMGANDVAAANEILSSAGIPTFPFPDAAARAFTYMARYTENLRYLYQTPANCDAAEPDRRTAEQILHEVRDSGRKILSEFESKRLLSCYHIPTVDTRVAKTEDEAVTAAEKSGYPVVVKLHSETITHKSDVGGVQLSIRNADEVRRAFRLIKENVTGRFSSGDFLGVTVQPMISGDSGYEVILGSSIDPQFGPVLLFGLGGQLVEIFRDRALALPPLNSTLARRLMERTKIYQAFKGVRGRSPVNLNELEALLVRFSQLVVEQPWISEIDINPLLVGSERLIALDARVVVHGLETKEEDLPRPAIRPYPFQYSFEARLQNGTPVTLRPIKPEDEPLVTEFYTALSGCASDSGNVQPPRSAEGITRRQPKEICFADYDREMTLLVVVTDSETGQGKILAIGNLRKIRSTNDAWVEVVVQEKYQHQGLNTELYRYMLQIAQSEGIGRVVSAIGSGADEMGAIFEHFGYQMERDEEHGLVRSTRAVVRTNHR